MVDIILKFLKLSFQLCYIKIKIKKILFSAVGYEIKPVSLPKPNCFTGLTVSSI